MRIRDFILLSIVGVIAVQSVHAEEAPLAVIMAAGHAHSLKKEEVALIFKRKKRLWGDGSKIQPVNLPASSAVRQEFSRAVLGAAPEELQHYWNDLYFNGISPPFVFASEEAVLRFVAETPGAIGYVPYCSVDNRVAIVLVIGASGRAGEEANAVACPR